MACTRLFVADTTSEPPTCHKLVPPTSSATAPAIPKLHTTSNAGDVSSDVAPYTVWWVCKGAITPTLVLVVPKASTYVIALALVSRPPGSSCCAATRPI